MNLNNLKLLIQFLYQNLIINHWNWDIKNKNLAKNITKCSLWYLFKSINYQKYILKIQYKKYIKCASATGKT